MTDFIGKLLTDKLQKWLPIGVVLQDLTYYILGRTLFLWMPLDFPLLFGEPEKKRFLCSQYNTLSSTWRRIAFLLLPLLFWGHPRPPLIQGRKKRNRPPFATYILLPHKKQALLFAPSSPGPAFPLVQEWENRWDFFSCFFPFFFFLFC